jgi:hypothetical protein
MNCVLGIPAQLEDYLTKTRAAIRLNWYQSLLTTSGETQKVLASRFYLLESYVERRTSQTYSERVTHVIETGKTEDQNSSSDQSTRQIQEALRRLQQIQQQTLPISLKSEGYGIPIQGTGSDHPSNDSTIPPELLAERKMLLETILSWTKTAFAPWLEELHAIQQNRLFFLKEMRAK